jgi:predicted AlkP superfamily phosphohydrolase/phosphomutase
VKRLIVLGLDAADPALLHSWSGQGYLPTFAALFSQGKAISIANDPGLYVGCVWPSFSTGSSPASHGRYCWRQHRAGTYDDEFFQIDQITGVPIWDHIDRAGHSVCVIDVPKSAPGPGFRGRFVKDWGTHDPSTGGFRIFGWMDSKDFTARYGRDDVGRCDAIERTEAGYRQFRDRLTARALSRARMLTDVLSEQRHDVVMAVFSEAHCAGHQCWHIHDEAHARHSAPLRRALGDPLLDTYRALDEAFRQILLRTTADDTVLVLASHGMGPHYSGVEALNSIALTLEHEGSPGDHADELPARIPHLLSPDSADFRRQLKAFPVPNNGAFAAFRLNILGREPAGKLRPGEVDAFLRKLEAALLELRNADSGEPIFRCAVRVRDTYTGSRLHQLPDLLLEWNRASSIRRISTARSVISNSDGANPRTGDHKSDGQLWVHGSGPMTHCWPDKLQMSEVAPHILALINAVPATGESRSFAQPQRVLP